MLLSLFVNSRNGIVDSALISFIKLLFFFLNRLRQVIREVDAPFHSRHGEYGDVYDELSIEKNSYEQGYNAESNMDKLLEETYLL